LGKKKPEFSEINKFKDHLYFSNVKVYKKWLEKAGTADSKSVQKWTRARIPCSSPSQRERPAAPCLLSFSSL
jgi:hypothetical protein